MKLTRIGAGWRVICLALGAGFFAMAWYLTNIARSGIEDVPPPFILAAGLASIALLCVGVFGQLPWPNSDKQKG